MMNNKENIRLKLTEKSGHMAWCALVALALARENSSGLSPAQEMSSSRAGCRLR